MFIPVGVDEQVIIQVDKDENGKVTKKELMGVMVRIILLRHLVQRSPITIFQYVPLTDRKKVSATMFLP